MYDTRRVKHVNVYDGQAQVGCQTFKYNKLNTIRFHYIHIKEHYTTSTTGRGKMLVFDFVMNCFPPNAFT